MIGQVIQNIKLNLTTILHRGHEEYSSDPYSNNLKKATYGKFVGRSKQTLGTNKSSTRCSSTLPSYIKNNRNIRVAGISASFALAIISALTIYPIVREQRLAEATAGTATASTTALTMTSSASADLNLFVKDSNGTFSSSSEDELATFGIITNNYTGYTLTIAGSDSTKQLSTTSGDTLDSIEYPTTPEAFASASTYNGQWGYLPNKYNSAVNTQYRPSPTTSATTLDKTSSANTNSNNYTITLGARANYDTPSGTYFKRFILSVIGNPVAYTIGYDKGNTTDTVTNLPAAQSSSTSATSINLSTTIPVRTGYAFLGWCYGNISTNATTGTDSCVSSSTTPGAVYNPNGGGTNLSFGIDQTTTNIVTLHAMWKVQSMQAWTGCNALSSGDKVTLTDARDNQEYDIVKIGDYCVMAENLAIGTTGTNTIPANGSNFTGSDITIDYTDYSYFTSTYIGNKVILKDDNFGAYYNYCLASAGTVCSTTNTNAEVDICPTNWKMPSSSSWNLMRNVSGSGTLFAAQLSGYHTSSASASGTSYGYYWSNISNSTSYPYYLYGTPTSLNTATYGRYRYEGLSIRCMYNPSVTVKVSASTGISNVSINSGTASSTATYTGHMDDTINLALTPRTSYGPAYTWTKSSGSGTLANTSTNVETNTFTLGPSDANITTTGKSGVAVIIKTGTGVSNISLNGTSCSSTAGCYITGLTPGATYDLVATLAEEYTFTGWTVTAGAINSTSSTSTRFTVPSSSHGTVATITPSATINKYVITFKTSNAAGIIFNGTKYTNGQTATINAGTYTMYGDYNNRYTFSSWTTSGGGTIGSTTAKVTTFKVASSAATITLTGKSVSTAIQNLSASSCTTTAGEYYDNRDGQAYTVKKLADGKCWMIENLNLGAKTLSTNLTSSNTNLSTTIAYTTFNEWIKSYGNFKYDYTVGYLVPVTGGDPVANAPYGVLYNYCALSAQTICTKDNELDASYDLCPAGWRLPTLTEIKALSTAYSSSFSSLHASIANSGAAISLAGWSAPYNYGGYGEQGYSARLLTSTHKTSARMYIIHLESPDKVFIESDYGGRESGYSARCIHK